MLTIRVTETLKTTTPGVKDIYRHMCIQIFQKSAMVEFSHFSAWLVFFWLKKARHTTPILNTSFIVLFEKKVSF